MQYRPSRHISCLYYLFPGKLRKHLRMLLFPERIVFIASKHIYTGTLIIFSFRTVNFGLRGPAKSPEKIPGERELLYTLPEHISAQNYECIPNKVDSKDHFRELDFSARDAK